MRRTVSPVILVPGMTASVLHDEYELPPEAVWTTAVKRRYERITLHPLTLGPGDRPYELREPARVGPHGPFPAIYEDRSRNCATAFPRTVPHPSPSSPSATTGACRSAEPKTG